MKFLHKINARIIYNSRGEKTIECDVLFKSDEHIFLVRRSAPSGKSTGGKEAVEVLPNEGLVHLKNIVFPSLFNSDLSIFDQKAIDEHLHKLDGTDDLKKLGSNTLLPVSTSFSSYCAYVNKINLYEYINKYFSSVYRETTPSIPQVFFNIINGGKHSGSPLVFQEIMISWKEEKFPVLMEKATEFYKQLKEKIAKEYGEIFTGCGDEGGFALPIFDIEEILNFLLAIDNSVEISIDCAANSFYVDGVYKINENEYSTDSLLTFYTDLLSKYENIKILEDPFAETDLDGFKKLKESCSIYVMGDDISVSNEKYINSEYINSVLLKPNQVGLLDRLYRSINKAKEENMPIMISHRSGETEDQFIVSLAVGIGADYMKCGAPQRGERISKYNELIRIFNKFN